MPRWEDYVVRGGLAGLDARKRAKQQLLQTLAQSGLFTPTGMAQPQAQTFGQDIKGAFLGPDLPTGEGFAHGGLQYQRQTPELQAQRLQTQLSGIQPLLGEMGTELEPEISLEPTGVGGIGLGGIKLKRRKKEKAKTEKFLLEQPPRERIKTGGFFGIGAKEEFNDNEFKIIRNIKTKRDLQELIRDREDYEAEGIDVQKIIDYFRTKTGTIQTF